MQVLSALGDPLYAIGADGAIEPRLATAPPILSADGLRARIPLRQGVRFHDGTPFDAAAMVRACSSHEIELELKAPFSPLHRLLSAICLTPVSPTAYCGHTDMPVNDHFVGTGPYRLSFFSAQQQRLTPFIARTTALQNRCASYAKTRPLMRPPARTKESGTCRSAHLDHNR